jgi:hypothetical protein
MGRLKEFEDPVEGTVIYDSTNKYMHFAIDVMDEGYSLISNAHDSLAIWYDNLLPIELKDINYLPAIHMMQHWINLFFYNMSRGGLIPTLAQISGRRYYDQSTGEWKHMSGDTRGSCTLEGMYASIVRMFERIHIFLSWFSDTTTTNTQNLISHCKTWADAFMQTNSDNNWYGHVAGGWKLYNYVHTGPPSGIPNDTSDKEMQFRFAFEGFPDSGLVYAFEYGFVAKAFLLLSKISGDEKYADFAASINDGLWNSRFNHNNYLMPDSITPWGPLPGDQDPGPQNPGDQDPMHQFKYKYDTDCLYWARAIFETYGIFDKNRTDLRPLETEDARCGRTNNLRALKCRVNIRKNKLLPLFTGTREDKYLAMALGLTLDWIGYGWNPDWSQFIRKIHHDGTPGETRIYGDGKWNTLYILIEAYRFTHDNFYLRTFNQAWKHFEDLAQDGFFLQSLKSGDIDPDPNASGIEENQDAFLDVIVTAYLATMEAGNPQQDYLNIAREFADRIMEAHVGGKNYYVNAHGLVGKAYLGLALAEGTLRRVSIHLSEEGLRLIFQQVGSSDFQIQVPGKHAVIYMNNGQYNIVKQRPDGTVLSESNYMVTSDSEIDL